MGRLYLPAQFFDGNGDPLAGGKVYTFDAAATTTPKATYTTNALSVAHANPIVLDGDGRLPDVFAETGEGFFIEVTDAADDPIDEFENVEALGESSTDNITRTFTASRYRVSSGEVETGNDGTLVEYGSLSPVNSGGYVKESGWAETQGTKKIIDFAAVEMTGTLDVSGAADVGGALAVGGALSTGGLITENGKKLPGVVHTTTTPTAASAITLALPESPDNVRAWTIEAVDVVLSATADISITLSYDNASTFKTGVSDYAYVSQRVTSGASVGITGDDANANGLLGSGVRTPTNKPAMLRMMVATPESGSGSTSIGGHLFSYDNGSSPPFPMVTQFHVLGLGAYGRATHLKLTVSTGTITGTFRVIPMRGFGE